MQRHLVLQAFALTVLPNLSKQVCEPASCHRSIKQRHQARRPCCCDTKNSPHRSPASSSNEHWASTIFRSPCTHHQPATTLLNVLAPYAANTFHRMHKWFGAAFHCITAPGKNCQRTTKKACANRSPTTCFWCMAGTMTCSRWSRATASQMLWTFLTHTLPSKSSRESVRAIMNLSVCSKPGLRRSNGPKQIKNDVVTQSDPSCCSHMSFVSVTYRGWV